MKKATGMKSWISSVNDKFLMVVVAVVGTIVRKAVGIHPARVKNLVISTNINGDKLKENEYQSSDHYKSRLEIGLKIVVESI